VNPLAVQRIALVIPWYGLDTAGGAEVHGRRLAESLYQAGVAVEVLTSTAKDSFSPDQKYCYPSGQQEVNGVPVVRFPTRSDDGAAWRQAHLHLLPDGRPFPPRECHLIDQMVAGDALYEHIKQHAQDTLFLLMPSIWGTTFWGSLLARNQAVLIPCLHDEPHAHYSVYRYLFRSVRGILFNSQPEMELATRLYDLAPERCRVVGEGVDMHGQGDPERFRQRFGIEEPFVLYLGRRDRGKRVPMLIEYFCAYKDRHAGPLKLVLAGKNPIFAPLEFADQVIDLEYISEQEKHDAYAAATIVCQPSVVESFSLVIMESWLQGTPVLVNAECAVTMHHCRQSNGGLYFKDFFEFEACLNYLLERPVLCQRMGVQGQEYVHENYSWPAVVQRIIAALEDLGVQTPYRSNQLIN
jgi:glycosyltransferase involved in cell wall biosynthesis